MTEIRVGDRVKMATHESVISSFRGSEGVVVGLEGVLALVDFDDHKKANKDPYRCKQANLTVIDQPPSAEDIARLFGVTPTRSINLELDRYEKLDIIARSSSMPMSVEGLVHIAIDAFLEGAWEDGIYTPREEED